MDVSNYEISPFGYGIVSGQITGKTPLYKIGYQATVNNTEIDLWNVAAAYVFPAAAQQMEVYSSSTNDAAGQTGALTVKIWYLTSSFVEKTETVTMTGQTAAATVATDIYRVNAFRVMTTGTGKAAAGTISLRNLADTPIYSQIAVGQTRARNSVYTVPVGKTLYISQVIYSTGNKSGNRFVKFTLRATYDDKVGATTGIFYPYNEIGMQDGAIAVHLDLPIKLIAGTDVKISAVSDSSSADAVCTGSYRGWLE